MLTIPGRRHSGFYDRLSRRGFLRIGALGMGAGALTLADVFRAEAQAGGRSGHKSVIPSGRPQCLVEMSPIRELV